MATAINGMRFPTYAHARGFALRITSMSIFQGRATVGNIMTPGAEKEDWTLCFCDLDLLPEILKK
jgi:hypothetical protein